MPEAVYFLCAVTSVGCAALLFRSYGRTRVRLLLWSGSCFIALAATNILLFIDLVLVPGTDLSLYRTAITLLGLLLLVYGLVTES